jgi:DNA-binding NarL/FixJ family response regulator
MRKQGVKCPIVMLTAHDTDADTILGLDAGAKVFRVMLDRAIKAEALALEATE